MVVPEPVQEQYRLLRQRLDQLEYRDPFRPDSMRLIQKLLSDLIQTTESCKRLKLSKDNLIQDKKSLEQTLEPLRNEISRLTAENNQLHVTIINETDKRESQAKKTAIVIRKLENEISDLKFLNSQYLNRIHAEQKRADDERKRVEDLFKKWGIWATVNDGEGVTKTSAKVDKLFQRLQKLDMETGLEPMSPPHDTIRLPEPHMVDMVKIVEAKVDILEKEKEELLLRATDFKSEIQLYREQITNREQEIARLGALLEASRAQSFVTGGVSGITSAKNSRVEQLEMQVEYLQEHVQSLESDLSQAANKRNDKMEELERQKHNIEMELENAKEKNAKLIKSLERLEKTINSLRGKGSPSKVASSPDVSTSGQKSRSVKIQSSVNPEVSGLVDDLQEELATMEELLHTTTDQHTLLKTDFDKIHQENAKLHDELRQLRETISSLQNQTLGSNAPSTASASLTTTTNLDSDVNQLKTKLQSLETTKWTLESEVKSLRQKLEQALKHTKDLESSQSTVQNIHRDLKESKGEIHMWVEKVQEMEKERQKLLTSQRSIETKLHDMTRERNDLLQSLQQFDSQLKTFQDQIVDITRDRDNFQALYKQVTKEIQSLRDKRPSPAKSSPQSSRIPRSSSSGTADKKRIGELTEELANLQDEVNDLKSDRDRIVSEKDSLQQQLDEIINQPQSQPNEIDLEEQRGGLEKKYAEKLKSLENERDGLKMSQLTSIHDLNMAKEKLNQLDRQLFEKTEELNRREKVIEQMKDRLTKSEQEKVEMSHKLTSTTTEVETLRKQCENLEAQIAHSQNEQKETSKTLQEQKETIAEMEHEKGGLNKDLLDRQRKIEELQGRLQQLKTESKKAHADLSASSEKIDVLNHHLSLREKDLKQLHKEYSNMTADRDRWISDCQRAEEEIRNVTVDLSTVTKENQILNGEIAELGQERDDLRQALNHAEQQISHLNEIVQSKEQERDQLLSSYRKLIVEHDKLEGSLNSTTDETGNLRMECLVKDKKIEQLEKTLEDAIGEAKQLRVDLTTSEKQCSHLTRTLATVERDLRATEIDKTKLLREIASSKEMSLNLDKSKGSLQKQVTNLSMEVERLKNELKNAEIEKGIIMKRLNNQESKSDQLETFVSTERAKKTSESPGKDVKKTSLVSEARPSSRTGTSITSLLSEIKSHVEDKQKLQRKIDELEGLLLECRQDLHETRDKVESLSQAIESHKAKIQEKDKMINELLSEKQSDTTDESISSRGDKSAFEKKIMSELKETKRQLKRYEEQIAKRYKNKNHVASDTLNDVDSDLESTDSVTKDLVSKWKAQNEAMKREFQSSSNPLPIATPKNILSDAKRKELEAENKRLLETIIQVKEDLLNSNTTTTTNTSTPSGTSGMSSLSGILSNSRSRSGKSDSRNSGTSGSGSGSGSGSDGSNSNSNVSEEIEGSTIATPSFLKSMSNSQRSMG